MKSAKQASGGRGAPTSADDASTCEKLVRAAEVLMLRDGYSATRVDDVLAKAGLSKGSFYHLFDSKESLGVAVLDHYYADRAGRLAAGPYAADPDPAQRARRFLDHASRIAEDLWSMGCLLASFSADAAASSRVISKALRQRTGQLRALLMDVLGPLSTPDATAADLADQFLVCVEGSIVLARIYGDPSYLRRGLMQFRRCLRKS